MKNCPSCKRDLPLSDFHRHAQRGYQPICKLCKSAVDAARYADDPAHHSEIRERRRIEISAWAFELKRGRFCTDCKHSFHPAAMQWDHTGSDKTANVSDVVRNGSSKKRILAEMSKCELVCANCHAIRTYNRRGIAQVGSAHASGA